MQILLIKHIYFSYGGGGGEELQKTPLHQYNRSSTEISVIFAYYRAALKKAICKKLEPLRHYKIVLNVSNHDTKNAFFFNILYSSFDVYIITSSSIRQLLALIPAGDARCFSADKKMTSIKQNITWRHLKASILPSVRLI